MTKRILALVLVFMLLAASALAEIAGPLFEADSLSDSYAATSGAFIFTKDRMEGLVDREGNVLCDAQFGDLSYAAWGYYEATNEGGFNTSALVNTSGEAMTPFEYSDFKVVSPNWAVAVVLEGTNDKDNSDYTVIFGSYDYAVVVRYDVFYLPEKKLVDTLERKQFSRGKETGLGGYLLVEDSSGNVTLYDSAFNPVDTLLTSMYDPELIVKSESELTAKALYSAVTGEKLADREYDYLTGMNNGGAVFCDYDTRLYGILSPSGEEICPPTYSMISSSLYEGRYVKVTVNKDDGTSAEGLYDLEERKEVIPPLYQRIYQWGEKHIINNGYVCVEQDGKLGFIDLEGNVTCPIQYAKDSVKDYGCTLGAVDLTGAVTLIAADGTVTALEGVTEINIKNGNTDSDGYYLTVKDADDHQAVIDWHGNYLTEFALDYSAAIYGTDCLSTNTSLYKLPR